MLVLSQKKYQSINGDKLAKRYIGIFLNKKFENRIGQEKFNLKKFRFRLKNCKKNLPKILNFGKVKFIINCFKITKAQCLQLIFFEFFQII